MNSNNPIQSLWIGTELSPMEILCIKSYLANGHVFHLYTYHNLSGIPKGTVVKDANSIIPEKDIYIDRFGSYAHIADQFRFTLLYKIGGWWVDMDTVCLKHFDFEDDFVFSSERCDSLKQRCKVNNTYIKSEPCAKFLKDCLDFISVRGHEHIHWGELGVSLFSRMIFRNKMEQYIKSPDYFCPVSYYEFDVFIEDKPYVIPETSCALHWWNYFWSRDNVDKNSAFPKKSLYEVMKEKYY